MYFTLTFDILTTDTGDKPKIQSFIKSLFKGTYWAKPLSNHYIVKCDDERIRRRLLNTLIKYSKENPNKIRYILSPLIDTGRVAGVTSKELWVHLRNITDSDFDDINGFF